MLQEMRAKSVDPKKTLAQQTFPDVAWIPGKPAEELFTEIHQKQKR